MPLSFPLPREDFIDILPIAEMSLVLPETAQVARTRGGEVLPFELGEPLWEGEVKLGRMTRPESGRPLALIDVLRQPGRSFLVCDTTRTGPLSDPAGVILGAATPVIHELPEDPRELRLSGLPAGYILSAGDWIGWSHGAAPTRYALHRIVDAEVVAAGTGITPAFEVVPHIRPGVTVGAAVQLIRPVAKAIILPGQTEPGRTRRTLTDGAGFSFIQSLR